MTAIQYPVARTAEEALARPLARAARAREAGELATAAVRFVTEDVGPAFETREAALDAYPGRLDDERPGRPAIAGEDRYCVLREVAVGGAAPAPREPTFAKGRRWPKSPGRRQATRFRLSVSYWQVVAAEAEAATPADQARALRRRGEAAQLDARELRALAQQPLRPVRPQQPLDIGLFENPAPEAPHILIPDD